MSIEELRFAEEAALSPERVPWTLLIVDDEPEVHRVTTLALQEFSFAGRGLRFLHASSGAEAKQLLRAHAEIALVLLDVVMETDNAGLDVVQFVRNELGNRFVRIILRTGQPGQAPELEVIRRYDINDYKHKTELTRERLFTSVYTSLSTYRDLLCLDASRRGLEKVIEASARIFELQSLERFAQGVLEQLVALVFPDQNALVIRAAGVATTEERSTLRIVAGTGPFEAMIGQDARTSLPAEVLRRIQTARSAKTCIYGSDHFVGYQGGGDEIIFYVGADAPVSISDRRLVEMFYRNVAIAESNLRHWTDRRKTGDGTT